MVQRRRSTTVRKQQIIDAARKLIIKKGSEHLTVRGIAKEVNLTEAAIYRHFKSKKEILSFLMKHITESMLDGINNTLLESSLSLEDLSGMLIHHLSDIEQRRGMSFQVIAEIISLGDKKLNRQVYESIRAYTERLMTLLSEGAKKGFVRNDIDFQASALLLFGMIQGLVYLWALSNYSFDLVERYGDQWRVLREALVKR